MTETEIIHLLWLRNPDSIAQLKEKYYAYCFSIAYNIVQNNEDAEECVADTMFKIWQSVPPVCPKSLKIYAGRITRNLALNRFRSERTNKRGNGISCVALAELSECVEAAENVELSIEQNELNSVVQRFIESLKPADRRLFLRRYYYADDIPSIATRFGMTKANVKVRLHRIREALKKELEKEGYIERHERK